MDDAEAQMLRCERSVKVLGWFTQGSFGLVQTARTPKWSFPSASPQDFCWKGWMLESIIRRSSVSQMCNIKIH